MLVAKLAHPYLEVAFPCADDSLGEGTQLQQAHKPDDKTSFHHNGYCLVLKSVSATKIRNFSHVLSICRKNATCRIEFSGCSTKASRVLS